MKSLLVLALTSLTLYTPSIHACEFTSIGATFKVQSRTIDHANLKEKIKTIGKVSGDFVQNSNGSFNVFKTKQKEHPVARISIEERNSNYSTSITVNTSLKGLTVLSLLEEAIGTKKLKKNPQFRLMMNEVTPSSTIYLRSYYYNFSGAYYGEVDDETVDSFELVDPKNGENKLLITVDFKRKTKCN